MNLFLTFPPHPIELKAELINQHLMENIDEDYLMRIEFN